MIPIYRAKKIDSDEWVEGLLFINHLGDYTKQESKSLLDIEIDPNTLAIHFKNMIDKNGKKIFASLSEDGVGGDRYKTGNIITVACVNHGNAINPPFYFDMDTIEVIGIHKGKTNE